MSKLRNFSQQYRLILLALVTCSIGGAGLGWYVTHTDLSHPAQSPQTNERNQEARYDLPPGPPVLIDLGQARLAPRVLRTWELTARQPLPARKSALTAPNWKIVGVTTAGKEQLVLLLFESQTSPETRKVGDKLPGGAKILQISQDELQIALNGQSMKLSLHKQ